MMWQKLKTEVYTHRSHLLMCVLFYSMWVFMLVVPPLNMQPDAGWWGPAMWIALMLFFGFISTVAFAGTWRKEVNATVWGDFGDDHRAARASWFCEEHKIQHKRATKKDSTKVGFLNEDDLVLVMMSV